MEEYDSKIANAGGAVFLAVCRGKVSGVSFVVTKDYFHSFLFCFVCFVFMFFFSFPLFFFFLFPFFDFTLFSLFSFLPFSPFPPFPLSPFFRFCVLSCVCLVLLIREEDDI